jgi:hypothetical protein
LASCLGGDSAWSACGLDGGRARALRRDIAGPKSHRSTCAVIEMTDGWADGGQMQESLLLV